MHWLEFETEEIDSNPFSIFHIYIFYFLHFFQVWKTSLQISILCTNLGQVFINIKSRLFHFSCTTYNELSSGSYNNNSAMTTVFLCTGCCIQI